jgi:hypothetical protein
MEFGLLRPTHDFLGAAYLFRTERSSMSVSGIAFGGSWIGNGGPQDDE